MHFLIVDDDSMMRDCIADTLSAMDYTSVQTGRPEDVASLVESNNFDYVICDIGMPGMNGIEMMKKVKQISPGTLFICVSGLQSIFEDELSELAELTIQKPFLPEDLLRSINKLVAKNKST